LQTAELVDLAPAALGLRHEDATVHGGMIAKVKTCLKALEDGVEVAVISDGRAEHAVLLELFAERGFGTAIWQGEAG